MERREVRKQYQPFFEELFKAYPVHQDFQGGFNQFLDLLIDEPDVNLDFILEKARAFARNTDPSDLKYVPLIRRWLRDRRYEDIDLFTDQVVAQREWLVGCYRRGDTRAITDKYGFLYAHPPVPEDVVDLEAWHMDQRKLWIGQIGNHLLHGGPYPE